MDEMLDLVDQNDKVIGKVSRAEAHSDQSKIHREVAIFLFNNKGETLLSQRSLKKKRAPGWWDISAAGHVGADEEPKMTAMRELKEELGIEIVLKFYKKHFDQSQGESRFIWCFYGIYNSDIFEIDSEEVEAVEWVKISELDNFGNKHLYDKNYWAHEMTKEIFNNLLL